MSDTIYLDDPHTFWVPREEIEEGWIKHVNCNGARFHVLSYSTLGIRCSEERCIINKYYQDRQKDNDLIRSD